MTGSTIRRVAITTATALALATLGAVSAQSAGAAAGGGSGWTMSGYDIENTRFAKTSSISPQNVGQLQAKWRVATEGDVSATPAVEGTTLYVPDFAGNLYALDTNTGIQKWKIKIGDYTGIPGDHSRATPAISGNTLVLGDQAGKVGSPDGYLLGINKNNGALIWKTKLTGGFPIVTQSPTIHGNTAYVGVASFEEGLVRFGVPLTFRGYLMAVDTNTGAITWTTYMVPDGYTGGAIWGSSPAVDVKRGSVYVATGNNYSIPQSATDCLLAAASDAAAAACMPANNYFDAIVALDLKTGAIKWGTKALPSDAWNLACGIPFVPGFEDPVAGCPEGPGPDFDFGQGPALFTIKAGGKPTDVVGAGQKSGKYWALNPDTGAVIWSTQAAPGGIAGGLQWGSATDGTRVYIANSNSEFKPWAQLSGPPVVNGGWGALDASTGQILWQTLNPAFGNGMGPVSGANGVIYACSMDVDGHMYAMDAATGTILWDFASGASCLGGAAVTQSMVFWGTGYDAFSQGPDGDQAIYGFGL